ncbi:TetR family transcriptional regulator [Mycobacterium rhizamassiliense]|uniref:TetR family transcriptional regulator n=1 Tax=Mycobacterium rhizamassiliense TaxID=1841860 RepID=A0A2U3NX31_9MYCO|nr:TetR-like C-terminal domain-containing protein [Mycobacterium rhizamassiliense]SPM36071.1 TetR family transcriptional regulator [Mycobacterium rhizamassiliense]
MSADVPVPEDFRKRVLDAACDELIRWGVDRFSIVALADRHGLDPELIQQHWPTADRLVLEVLLGWPSTERFELPDTGLLHTDLLALATWMADYVTSETGRGLQLAHIIANPNLPTARIRKEAWRARSDNLRVVVERARERGELRDGVDALSLLELLFAPINMRELFTGEPVDEEYCRNLAELVCRAVATAP